jgi:hypothetical protein
LWGITLHAAAAVKFLAIAVLVTSIATLYSSECNSELTQVRAFFATGTIESGMGRELRSSNVDQEIRFELTAPVYVTPNKFAPLSALGRSARSPSEGIQ